jgi:tetratricopeptide (TPR) repeat protein
MAYLKKAQSLQKLEELDEHSGIEIQLDGSETDELKDTKNKQGQIKTVIEKALELIPDMPEVLMQMGKMHYKLSAVEEGNIDKAITMYTKAIQLKPDYAAAYSNLGVLYASEAYLREKNDNLQDNLNKAINEFTEALRIRPFDETYYFNRGEAYSKLENHKKAIDDFSSAINYGSEEFKTVTSIFYFRGEEYSWLRNYEKAIDAYSESIHLNPAHNRSLLMRGNAYLRAGKKDKAKADFDTYLQKKRLLENVVP